MHYQSLGRHGQDGRHMARQLKAEDKNQETLRSYVKDIKVFAKYLAGRGLVGPLALELGDEKAIVALKISAICIAS
jgi:hypothetical protein